VQITVVPSGLTGAPAQAVIDYILAIYAERPKPDLIVTVTGPAAVFARTFRQQLFPDTPLLFAALDQRFLLHAPLTDNETAVPSLNDYPLFVETILQLRPQTRQVFMVMGAGAFRDFWRPELEKPFRRFQDRVTFVWLEDLSLPELLRRCANLPEGSAIFFVSFLTDAQGASYDEERVIADLHDTANAPLFGVQSVQMGAGMVGGSLTPIDALSRKTADVAIQLLKGAPPGSIRIPPQGPGQPIFDWRELQRWDIPESRLPPSSVVRYRAPSLWREYRGTVASAAGVLAIQSLLIVGLLYQRRARQRAESDSRRSLSLAADVSRRETMAALTSSIGHELGQPLGSILSNAHALRMMVTANRATSETIGEILTDIHTQGVHATEIIDRHRTMLKSHQLDKKPIDIHEVINETLGLVEHSMSMRQVETRVYFSSTPCFIDGDPVLLQQVFVNLVVNAADAMADIPPSRRHITISSSVRAAEVDVSVRDMGPGLPPHMIGGQFKPFVTTKAQGLGIGLTIVQTIVDAHGGTIVAHNHPEGGAIFTVTLRRSAASSSVAGALH
jgi:signal transduction histidine kinase